MKGEEEEEEEDRISKLPDNLIHDILYFIDMKFAVQTSVLSKRWKNVWTSLPYTTLSCASFLDAINYDLSDSVITNRLLDRLVGFIDKVFDSRHDSDIQMISLELLIINDALAIALNRWILAAVDHNVQNLDIYVGSYLNSSYEIPHQLLNCKSLKTLNIILVGRSFGETDIILPKSMSLPQIKLLGLNGISITNVELQRLFTSCPIMEMVIIQKCDIQTENQRNIIIDSNSLQTLSLVGNRHTHLGPADHSLTYTTKIYAPNAKGFMWTGCMTEDFSLENLSSLVRAQFKMRLREKEADETAETYSKLPAGEKEQFAKRMLKLLGAVHNVKILTLSSGFLEVLLQAPGTLYLRPAQLCNLEILKLDMRFTRGCLLSIAYLLKISPIITTLELRSMESNLADVGDDWEAGFLKTCMFSHLKFVKIREVEGCDNELKLLSFLLKKSMVLEKVNLFFLSTSFSLDRESQLRRFERNLKALPTASSSMQMQLH